MGGCETRWDEETYLTFYEDAANKKVFNNRGGRRAKNQKTPRMVAVLDTDGSPWEVLKALRCYEEDETSLLQPEHTKFIKKYLLQYDKRSIGKGESVGH